VQTESWDGHYVHLLPRIMRIVEGRFRWMKKVSNTYEVFVRKPAYNWPVGIFRLIG
jgi:hypothetical protein